MSWFTRNRFNKLEEIAKRDEMRARGEHVPEPRQPAFTVTKTDAESEIRNSLGVRGEIVDVRPLSAAENMGLGYSAESPTHAALRKREEARLHQACKSFLRL